MLCPLSYVEWGDCWVLPPTRLGHSQASMLMVNHREWRRVCQHGEAQGFAWFRRDPTLVDSQGFAPCTGCLSGGPAQLATRCHR